MIENMKTSYEVTPSGGLEFRGDAPWFLKLDIDPQVALKIARAIIKIHDAIYEREKALRDDETERTR